MTKAKTPTTTDPIATLKSFDPTKTPDDSDLTAHAKYIAAKNEKLQVLERGYTFRKRCQDIFAIIAFSLYLVYNVWCIARAFLEVTTTSEEMISLYYGVAMVLVSTFLGILLADYYSGLVHWAADTWGTVQWPYVGPTFIRNFREHHIDPSAMCRKDWIRTNGDNCLAGLVFLSFEHAACFAIFLAGGEAYFTSSTSRLAWLFCHNVNVCYLFIRCFGTALSLFVMLTNQFHKWSHTFHTPKIVQMLQSMHIILPRSNHNIHHKSPFACYYCITTGWLNGILDGVGYWRGMEWCVTKLTGLQPRCDDQAWNSHLKFLKEEDALKVSRDGTFDEVDKKSQ